ncbi:aldo/keto reductase [Lysinibacillus yapensis]|uniref:Aldo/keto reductase n=1 Tax=Ureibacillus yapensis TaxID=2304605 RepID=A0A396SJP1_9BACL|nr:aldo/keto reductase [Lysinibacillus yapensis]RHW34067.1 aldo/keto reductase [Lysinibacillus yapensis]
MDYNLFGNSGLNVSKYALGTIPFSGTNGFEKAGDMDQETANYMVDYALDQGINQFDTANLYAKGDAEIVLGKAIRGKRHDMVISSKTGFQLTDNPNDVGATRINIESSIDATLKRLGTDYIDLYYVHCWDGQVPVYETVQVMNDLIKKGKIRYWGVSNYSGWALAKTHTLAVENKLMPPIAQQIYYTPESREAEYELLPAGKELGIANSIWSPLGEGLLTGKITRNKKAEPGTRQGNDWPEPYIKNLELFYDLVDLLQEVASKHKATVPQVVLAWLRDQPNVDSIVIAARNKEQLHENIASYNLKLTDDDISQITDLTAPEPIYPLWHRAMNSFDRASDAEKVYLEQYNKLMNSKNQDI